MVPINPPSFLAPYQVHGYYIYATEWVASFLDREPNRGHQFGKGTVIQYSRCGYQSGRTWEILDEITLVVLWPQSRAWWQSHRSGHYHQIDWRNFVSWWDRVFQTYKSVWMLLREPVQYENCKTIASRATSISGLRLVSIVRETKEPCGEHWKISSRRTSLRMSASTSLQTSLASSQSVWLLMAYPDQVDQYGVPPISEYDRELQMCWCIVREVTKKKTKNGKLFYVVDVIDNNSVQTRIRCWSVNPERDILYVNRPYMIKPQYNDTWGFSTRGSLNRTFVMLG